MEVTADMSIQRARETLALNTDTPARAYYVSRLDRPGRGYYLVIFDSRGAAVVDAQSGEINSYARLTGVAPQLPLDALRAAELAGAALIEPPILVWSPGRASLSMFCPFWQVRTSSGVVYIDQQGHRWTTLEPAGPG